MKKAFGLLYNTDERMILRSVLRDFASVGFAQHNEDAQRELALPGEIHLLIVDERFQVFPQNSKRAGTVEVPLSITEYIDTLQTKGKVTRETVIVVLMSEGRQPEDALIYSELGASQILFRPLGTKDLKDKIEIAANWAHNPSPEVKLRRVLRTLFEEGKFEDAARGFGRLLDLNPKDVASGLFLCRSLIELGDERKLRAMRMLEQLDRDNPRSLQTKSLLVDIYGQVGEHEKRALMAARLFETAPSVSSFELALSQARELRHTHQNRKGFERLFEVVAALDPLRTRPWRHALLESFASVATSTDELTLFFDRIDAIPDDRAMLTPALRSFFESSEGPNNETTWSPLLRKRLLENLLAVEPGHPKALRRHVRTCIPTNEFKAAWERLQQAREQKKLSPELFEAWAELSLAEGLKKDASDAIHNGRRLAPSDDRWNALADLWRAKFNAVWSQDDSAEVTNPGRKIAA